MIDSISIKEAFQSCEKWFPVVSRIQIDMAITDENANWRPTIKQWDEVAFFVGHLLTEIAKHSQVIREGVAGIKSLEPVEIQLGQQMHFSGDYKKTWKSASVAVVDETERLICQIMTQTTVEKETESMRLPSELQLSRMKKVVDEFCIQNELPRVCSELREKIRKEGYAALVDLSDQDVFNFDDLGK